MSDNKKKEEEEKEKEEGTQGRRRSKKTRLVRVEAQFSCFRENRLPLPDAT
jgi:hypothetical protein